MDELANGGGQAHCGAGTWPVLHLERKGRLVDQIVAAIELMVTRRELRVGSKMPSVRQFARCNGVSTFTVVESYERLGTLGLLSLIRHHGCIPVGIPCSAEESDFEVLTELAGKVWPELMFLTSAPS